MAASRDLRRLLAILDAEGFGIIAGEILSEIEAGRPVPRDDYAGGRDAAIAVKSEGSPDDQSEDEPLLREPIHPADQLGAAIAMLRLQLVEPARRLAEAERLAGQLMDRKPVRIVFVGDGEPINGLAITPAAPGDDRVAAELEALLARIADDAGEDGG